MNRLAVATLSVCILLVGAGGSARARVWHSPPIDDLALRERMKWVRVAHPDWLKG